MDELIRDMQSKAESARILRDTHTVNSESWKTWDIIGQTWDHASQLVYEAKRRMADREPAWDIVP